MKKSDCWIDVWIGALASKTLTGILCTFDTLRQDAEIKTVFDRDDDLQSIRNFHGPEMKTLYIPSEHQ